MNILIREATKFDYPIINKMLLKLQNYHSENIPTIYKKLNSFYFWCKYEYQRKQIWIEGIYVRAEYRRKGIAKKLVNEAINKAKFLNAQSVELMIWNFNETSKKIVKELGFNYGIATDSGKFYIEDDLYQIRRIGIFSDITMSKFKRRVKGNYNLKYTRWVYEG